MKNTVDRKAVKLQMVHSEGTLFCAISKVYQPRFRTYETISDEVEQAEKKGADRGQWVIWPDKPGVSWDWYISRTKLYSERLFG